MAEILNKTYGVGEVEALAADLQTLYQFKKVETGANDYGAEVKLWATDYTYLLIALDREGVAPSISVIHHGLTVDTSGRNSSNSSFTSAAIYAVRTNKAFMLTYQESTSSNVSLWRDIVTIGEAENAQTGAEETVVAVMIYKGSDKTFYPYICASDSSTTEINKPISINYESQIVKRNTVILPFLMDESAFATKHIYRLQYYQVSPFIGDCTFNGRKFFSLGVVLAEDD